MTSNLSVSYVATPATGSGAGQPTDNSGPLGAFGAMLDGIQSAIGRPRGLSHSSDAQPQSSSPPQNVPAADAGSNATTAVSAKNARTRHTGFSSATDQTSAATDPADGTPPKLLGDLVSALGDLDKAESDGGAIDDKLLKRVKDAVDAIAAYLVGQPQLAKSSAAAAPATEGDADTASPATAGTNKDAKIAAALAGARDSLSRLAGKLGSLSAGLGNDQSDLAAKLDDLARQLDPKSLAKATLTDLGLASEDGSPPDTRLAAAINALVDGKQPSAGADQPRLANAALKLPDSTTLTSADNAGGTSHHLDGRAPDPPPDARQPAVADASGKTAAGAKPATETKPDQPKSRDADDLAGMVKDATQPPAAVAGSSTAASATPAAAPTAAASATPDIRQAQSAYQTAPINLPQMAVEIAQHAKQGSNHFQIRLDPADMGRVNVSLAIDSSGTVNAHLTVERSETLDFLKRDQANLQQALQQAGLDAGKTNLQFSLSQNPFARRDGSADADAGNYTTGGNADSPDTVPALAATLYRGTASAGGLNLIV